MQKICLKYEEKSNDKYVNALQTIRKINKQREKNSLKKYHILKYKTQNIRQNQTSKIKELQYTQQRNRNHTIIMNKNRNTSKTKSQNKIYTSLAKIYHQKMKSMKNILPDQQNKHSQKYIKKMKTQSNPQNTNVQLKKIRITELYDTEKDKNPLFLQQRTKKYQRLMKIISRKYIIEMNDIETKRRCSAERIIQQQKQLIGKLKNTKLYYQMMEKSELKQYDS